MASSDGQHATPESHVEHAQEAAQKGRRQGDKSAKKGKCMDHPQYNSGPPIDPHGVN